MHIGGAITGSGVLPTTGWLPLKTSGLCPTQLLARRVAADSAIVTQTTNEGETHGKSL